MAGTGLIDWQGNNWPQSRAANFLLDLCQGILNRFGKQPTPMPIVVLEAAAAENDAEVREIVQALYGIYCSGGLLCKQPSVDDETDTSAPWLPEEAELRAGEGVAENKDKKDILRRLRPYQDALEMVRSLAGPKWINQRDSQYRPYSFPRSGMLAAIEAEYAAVRDDKGATPRLAAVLVRLQRRSWLWRPGRASRDGQAPQRAALIGTIAGSVVVAAAGAAASTLVEHQTTTTILLIVAAVLAVALGGGLVRRNLGPLSWLTPACRWFASTTFLVREEPSADGGRRGNWGPRRAWDERLARAQLVIKQFILAEGGTLPGGGNFIASAAGKHAALTGNHRADIAARERAWQFYLQLRGLALLEDLRACHRPSAFDMRHRKRACPPMAFLPGASMGNGGMALLQAISDVRSRRSEQDPLLIMASVPAGMPFEQRAGASGARPEDKISYRTWVTALRVNQSPSLGSVWPWVLYYRVTPAELTPERSDKRKPRAQRSWWARLWRRRTLAAAAMLAAVALLWRNADQMALAERLALMYCGGDPASAFHDLVRTPQSPGQCIGIDTTDAMDFLAPGGIRLSSAGSGPSRLSAGISLAVLERRINQQNRLAERGAGPYYTFVYAGALTSAADHTGQMQAMGATKELAGVYAWQYWANRWGPAGVRIDIANGGQDLNSQPLMVHQIVAAARLDPTIVGVIGLGRDTPTSQTAIHDLAAADLAVVDTTNSSDQLAQDWNYFGLGATNAEEVDYLRRELAHVANTSAVVFTREKADPYSHEQGRDAAKMLKAAGFGLVSGAPVRYAVTGDNPNFQPPGPDSPLAQVCTTTPHPSVVYLAGRSDDLRGLMTLIGNNSGCFAGRVTVLSGDDLTKSELTNPGYSIPTSVRLYYVALSDVSQTGGESNLSQYLKNALNLPAAPGYGDPFFDDGTVALGLDAAHALYSAAQLSTDRAGVPAYLRCTHITNAATGQLWFSGVHHGLTIVRVRGEGGRPPRIKVLPYIRATGPATVGAPCRPTSTPLILGRLAVRH